MRRALAFVLLLSGCTVGPDYRPPEAAAPPAFAGAQPAPNPAAPPVDPAAWWRAFRDPALDDLVARALRDSPDIATAASRVRQARLGEVVARSAYKPVVNASAGASHVEFSKNAGFSSLAQAFGGGASGGGGGGAGGGATGGGGSGGSGGPGQGIALPGDGITTYSAGLDASWEFDLFGGGRRQDEGARARTEAATWTARDAAVTLASEVAVTYFLLRLDQVQLAVLADELARQRRVLEIADNQSRVGLVPAADVTRQRGAITATEARLEPIRADLDVQVHALGVLLGRPPEELAALRGAGAAPGAGAVPIVPAGLPAELLRRRPDVRAAERQLAAATADIGVAVADLYPRLSLTGVAEFLSTALGNLFTGDSLQLTATGRAMFPLVDWGRRRATVGQREEARVQAYEAWRTTTLSALRDAEDALVQLDAERRRNAALARAVADQEASRNAISARYVTGLVAQDTLLTAEADVLSAREQLAASDAQLRRGTVALFKALGGGWQAAEPATSEQRPGS